MFDNLTNRLSYVLRNVSGRWKLNESNINETLREVRIALLEADVSLPVVRNFIDHVKKQALGQEINKNLSPGQMFIKIFRNELILAMGEKNQTLNLVSSLPSVVLVVGLQGVGKTTSVGKIGRFLREREKKKVIVSSIDVYRPAAIKQLEMLAKQASIKFFPSKIEQKPIDIAKSALKEAKLNFFDVLLIDTAGCLHIDLKMMSEMKQIASLVNPVEILFVLDATTGQNAVNTAKAFNEILELTGIIMTKVDGDARGGAALSVRYTIGKPIKFLGFGEKIESLEPFYPERIASRILGMGDVLSLIENIESRIDPKQAEKITNKLKKGNRFDFTDFLEFIFQMKKIGGITYLIDKLPGIKKISDNMKSQIDDRALCKIEVIIKSMTLKERTNPTIIKGSRKRRIATGCGMKIQDVNNLLRQFNDIQRMIKKIKHNGITKILQNLKNNFS